MNCMDMYPHTQVAQIKRRWQIVTVNLWRHMAQTKGRQLMGATDIQPLTVWTKRLLPQVSHMWRPRIEERQMRCAMDTCPNTARMMKPVSKGVNMHPSTWGTLTSRSLPTAAMDMQPHTLTKRHQRSPLRDATDMRTGK